ncbi:hypothetical protein BU23DRAFT_605031 [Bimuria novae-zelandiae CBS 107.79]|uniref:Mid2 domain-containing protein n=1 Tax=Bimuria novae-zelandiae CBS 107.79 TaxID=1447943 RepID=A0A6A5UGF5_9PLEO|nr:hypothetical protein BU23DRAFT_605031 [Bimuria novae-zelandiae CBS 107.79]
MRRSALILSVLTFLARNVRAGCYFPDGSIDKNVEYQPCSQDKTNPLSTICCATNRKDGADICSPNGLCQVGRKKGSPPADAAWTKPSCTNADWSEDGCLHVCGTDKYPFLTPCNRAAGNESQRWCCGDSQDCCNEDSGLSIEYLPVTFDPTIFNYTDASVVSSSSSSLSRSSSTLTSSSTTKTASFSINAPASTSATSTPTSLSPASASSTNTSPPAPTPSTGLSTGAKAGVGVGVTCGALSLIALGLLYGRRRHARSTSSVDELSSEKGAGAGAAVYAHWDHSQNGTVHGGSTHGGASPQPPATPLKDEINHVQVHEMPVCESRMELEAGKGTEKGVFA